jgi:hypothetical protein
MSFKVQNWPAYEVGLRRRGSLTLWIEDGGLDHWQSCGPDGQARYTDAAIQTSLMVGTAFKLPLRQAEGLMASVLTLMDLTISESDSNRRQYSNTLISLNDRVPDGIQAAASRRNISLTPAI